MATSVYPIYRAIGRPITVKGFSAQYLIAAAITLIADFLLFLFLHFAGLPAVPNIFLTAGLGFAALATLNRLSRKYGPYGLTRLLATPRLPEHIRAADIPSVLEIANDCIISNAGDITFGVQLFHPEQFTQSAAELEAMHRLKATALSQLPPGTTVAQQDWYVTNTYQVDFDGRQDSSFLTRSSDCHFHEKPWQEHRSYLFITHRSGTSRSKRRGLSGLLRPGLIPKFLLRAEEVNAFIDQCEQCMQILNDGGLITMRLGNKDLANLIKEYRQLTPPPATPELRDIQLRPTFHIGDKPMAIYSLSDASLMPAQCSSHIPYGPYSTEKTPFPVSPAIQLGPLLNADHIYNQIILLDDSRTWTKKLETRRKRLKSAAVYDRENAVAQADTESILNDAATENKRLVRAHYNVIIWADNQEQLSRKKKEAATAITRIAATPYLETANASAIWWACQPGNAGELPDTDSWLTTMEPACCFLTAQSHGRSWVSPFGFRFGERHTGVPIQVDLSDLPLVKKMIAARGKFILGPTGSGKSFLSLHMVRSYLEQGAHVLITDMGNSYRQLCELQDGEYFAYRIDKPMGFNPFLLAEDEVLDVEKRQFIIELLLVLLKQPGETLRRSEYVTLSNIVDGYFAWTKSSREWPCFNGLYEWVRDRFAPLLTREGVTGQQFDLQNFLYVLRPYYRDGEYDYLLNASEQLDLLHQRMIVFELDEIKDHPILYPVIMLLIADTFLSKMRRLPGIRKVFVMDECWKALIKTGSATLILYIWKTVRKFFGEPIAITQELEDLIGSPIVKNTIINMSDCKILLDMGRYANRFDEIQNLLGLTDTDKALVLSLNKANEPGKNYKEVFVSLGTSYSRVYRVELSLEEYLVYTTEERERVKVREYTSKHGSLIKGVKSLAADIRSGAIRLLLAFLLVAAGSLLPGGRASAQLIDIIDAAVKKALMTADLAVQRLQTQTILLQNVQKDLENTMQNNMLSDITGWVRQQEELYSNYYQSLWQVKSVLSSYSKVAELVRRQAGLVQEYNQAQAAIRQDPHFSPAEITYIQNRYTAVLDESIRNTQQLSLVIKNFMTQMDDAARLRTIDETALRIDHNDDQLRQITRQTAILSLQRSKEDTEIHAIQQLYGINHQP
ncbi:MAG: TraG family conjugative transposon ATPase [Bacteroidetes bacterium]|nr:TraG family conjugative transposon ATPase [Bacteroidota bacterium]